MALVSLIVNKSAAPEEAIVSAPLTVNAVLNVAAASCSKRTSSLPSVPKYRLPVDASVALAESRVTFPLNVAKPLDSTLNCVDPPGIRLTESRDRRPNTPPAL